MPKLDGMGFAWDLAAMGKKARMAVVRGTGNVFRDLGSKKADVLQLKAILAAQIIKAVGHKGLAPQGRARIAAADLLRIRRADLRGFTPERLEAIVSRLGGP